MKKIYTTPMCDMTWMTEEEILAASGIIGLIEDDHIDYGGVDTDGYLNPDVKGESLNISW